MQGWILLPAPRPIVMFLIHYFSRATVTFANLLLRLHFPLVSVGHMPACVGVKGDFLGVEQHPQLPELSLSSVQLPGCSGSMSEPWGAVSNPTTLLSLTFRSPPSSCAAQVVHCVWTSVLLFLALHSKHTHKLIVLQHRVILS